MRRKSRDFSKPWDRDAHLPKLDPRLLPALKTRWWTPAELTDYCRQGPRSGLLTQPLVERWLKHAEERGLARRRPVTNGGAGEHWEATDAGRANAGFVSSVLESLGGLSGTLGVVSFLVAIYADRLPPHLRPIAAIAIIYLAGLLIGVVGGRVAAERSQMLLRRIVEREKSIRRGVGVEEPRASTSAVETPSGRS